MKTLRELRTEKGWTQEEMAEEVGAHWNTIARWERGEVPPDPKSRKLLAFVFGIKEGEIDFNGPIELAKSVG